MIKRKLINFSPMVRLEMSSFLEDGKVINKVAFDEANINLITRMLNVVVNGGIVVFELDRNNEESAEQSRLDFNSLIRKLSHDFQKSFSMLQLSSSESLLEKLSADLKTIINSRQADSFQLDVFRDTIAESEIFCGIELRNSSGLNEDLERIKSNSDIKSEIENKVRPLRRSDLELIPKLTDEGTRKILVAEDEDHLGRLIKFKLEREGFEVTWVKNGQDALDSIAKQIPDLLLLDIMMPVMDGYQVIKKLRQNDRTKNLPVIFLSAKGGEREVVRGIELGADDYIVKPFRPAELTARIKHTINE